MKYIVIPSIKYRGANANSLGWALTPPAPLQARGMVEKLMCGLGYNKPGEARVALIHHDNLYDIATIEKMSSSGHTFKQKSLLLKRGAVLRDEDDYVSARKGFGAIASLPKPTCQGVISIVIKVGDGFGCSEAQIRDELRMCRIAGGAIDGSPMARVYEDEAQAMASVGYGWIWVGREDLLQVPNPAADELGAFLSVTRPIKRSWNKYVEFHTPNSVPPTADHDLEGEVDSDNLTSPTSEKECEDEAPQNHWLIPHLTGYTTITPLGVQAFGRQAFAMEEERTQAAFAEARVSLAQLVPLKDVHKPTFWNYQDTYMKNPDAPMGIEFFVAPE